jgi:hypothetical protein
MPLDNRMYVNHNDEMFYQRAVWYLKFCWLPTRCALTNRLLWCTFAYQGTVMYSGPGSCVFEHKWIGKKDFLFAKLAGKI